jgi:23S rRNA (uridine2552-2'-O)-methyltransferase
MKQKGNIWADHYTQKAQKEHYPARSVYKLQEIQSKTRIIKKGDRVLDLGCSPGSWLLYAAQVVGEKGRVIGIDLKPVNIPLPPHAQAYIADIFAIDDALSDAIGHDFNAVISDMAPDTTGTKDVDAARSAALCEAALSVAKERLVVGGTFICKIFQGPDFKAFSDTVKQAFGQHKIFKPQSCRKASREIYIIGTGFKKI